jgi:hypothetical protein
LKPVQANSLGDPISKKNPSQKKAGGVAQGVGGKGERVSNSQSSSISPLNAVITGGYNFLFKNFFLVMGIKSTYAKHIVLTVFERVTHLFETYDWLVVGMPA